MNVRRPAIAFILAVVVIDVLAMGIIIPVLPKLVEQFMHGNTAEAARIYGLFGTAWALMQFIWSPIIGALSDRFGRRPVLLLSCTGLGLDYILMAFAPNLSWLFIGRVISGITAASFSTAGAYIADVTAPEKRAAAFGLIGAAFGIGFIIGPVFGGVLGAIDPRLPFKIAAALALANATYGYFVVPESLSRDKREGFSWKRANPIGSLKLLRGHPELFGLASVGMLNSLAHYVLPSTFVLYTGYRYGWDIKHVAWCLAAVGVCSVIVQGGLVKPFVKKFGERQSVMIGLFCGAVGFAIYGLAGNAGWFYLGIPIFAMLGVFSPAAQGLMTRHVSPSEQGQLQGANSSIMGIAGLIAPALFTQTFAFFIADKQLLQIPGAPFLLASLLMILAMFVAWRVTRNERA